MAILSAAARQGLTKTTRQPSNIDLQNPETRASVMAQLGVEKPEKQVDLFTRGMGILDAFRVTDDINYALETGDLLGAVGGALTDPLKKIGTLVTGKKFDTEDDEKGGKEILQKLGVEKDAGVVGDVGGFALDVLLDPTTYVTVGTGAGAKIMTKGGAKVLTKSGTKLFQKATKEALEEVAKLGSKELGEVLAKEGLEHLADKGIREIAEGLARNKVLNFADKGVDVLKSLGLKETDSIAKKVLTEGVIDEGGFKFAGKKLFDIGENTLGETGLKAFFDPISTAGEGIGKVSGLVRKSGKLGKGYGAALDSAKEGIGNFVGGATSTIRNLFDRKYNIAGGNVERFDGLIESFRKTEDYLNSQTEDVVNKFKSEYKDIIASFENPEILPYIIENTPVDKLNRLPDEIKEPLFRAVKQIEDPSIALASVKAAMQPNIETVKQLVGEELEPYVNIVAKSKTYENAITNGFPLGEDQFLQMKRQINRVDPSKPNIEELGNFKNIIDKSGVKKKVFDSTLTDSQIKKLNQKGFDTLEDLINKVDNKDFKKSRLVETPILSQRTSPTLTRLTAGREPEIKQISQKINELQTSSAYTSAKRDYDKLLSQAKQSGFNNVEDYIETVIGRDVDTFDPLLAKKSVRTNPEIMVYTDRIEALLDANKDALEEYTLLVEKSQGDVDRYIDSLKGEARQQAEGLVRRFDALQGEVLRITGQQDEAINELILDPRKYYEEEIQKIKNWRDIQQKISSLETERAKKIDELIDSSKRTEEIISNQPIRELSEYQQLVEELGMTPGQFDSMVKKARKTMQEAQEKANKAEVLLDQIYSISDPLQREIIDRQIARISENTEAMIEVGAIEDSAKANYIGREYLVTPGGKDLTQKKGIASIFGGSPKSMLDPKSVTNQKSRIYDYLADAVSAGGETTITQKGLTKEQTAAKLAEQFAKDEIKAISAKEFKTLADQILGKQITDAQGNTLYRTTQDVVDDLVSQEINIPRKILDAVENYKQTGNMPEQLKSYFREKGYMQLTQKGGGVIPAFKDVFFDPEAHQVLTNMHNAFFGDKDFNQIVKLYDKVQNTLKASQTAWFPAFHVRNAFSNVFSNAMAGMRDPLRYKEAIDLQRFSNLSQKLADSTNKKVVSTIQNQLDKIGDKLIKLGDGGEMKVRELYQLAKDNGVMGGGFYADLSDEIMGSKISGTKSLNPLSRDFILSQVGGKVGGAVEDNARIALFIDSLAKGNDVRSAALKVKEVLFDYGDLTDFEKNIMKRLVPYYTWTKKNAVLQMKRIINQPGQYKAMIQGFSDIRDAFSNLSEEDKEKLPDWAKEGVGIMYRTGGDGVSAITQFGLPHEAFQNLLSDNPLNQLGVPPKIAIELGTGQNIFKGKAILDDTDGKAFRNFPEYIKERMGYRQETRKTKEGREYTVYYVDPWAKYWVGTLLGRTQSTASKISTLGDAGDTPADLVNLLTGVKKYDFNLTEEAEKRNREQAKELYRALVDKGYAREYTSQFLTPETKNILASIRD